MKRYTACFLTHIFLLFGVTVAEAQIQWEAIHGPTERLLALAIHSEGYIFAGNQSGVYCSTNGGADWNRVMNAYVQSLVIDKNRAIFAGTLYGGVFRSTDTGSTWDYLGLVNRDVSSCALNDSGHIFAATRNDGIFRSKDNGATFVRVSNLLWNEEMKIKDNDHLFIADGALIRSTDNGDTWENVWPHGFPPTQSLALNSEGHIFVGTVLRGIFKSTDEGKNWERLTPSPDTLGYRSWNAWIIETLVINEKGHIFGGIFDLNTPVDTGGIVMSTDGVTWQQVNSGLPYTNIWSLAIDKNGYVFAGTSREGVFRTKERTAASVREISGTPALFSLGQNYPNPFNPLTKIVFELPKETEASLVIYNMLGQSVLTIFENELYHRGRYEVDINASSLPSGAYFYRLECEEFGASKKMLLIK